MKRIVYYLIAFTTLLAACKSEKEQKLAEIQRVEKSLFGDKSAFNDSIARQYLRLSDQYISLNKGDENIPDLIFKQAEILNGLQNYSYSIRKFQYVYTQFPNHPKAAESVFLCAFIYDTYLQKYEDAGRYYRLFLRKYPNHTFAKDAQISLNNLGKTPDELVKEFEARNADSLNIQ